MQTQVLNYSATVEDDGSFRLDAEHYQEQFLRNQQKLIRFGATPLLKLISRPVMTGHTPSMKVESYYGGNIVFVKTDNLREFEISGEFTHRLTETGNEVIKRSVLQTGDLIVTIIGATYKIVGRAALVRKEDSPANINQNVALIRLKKAYSPEFLSAYLNCNIGRLALWYLSRQTEQVNLNCREVEKVLVPDVSDFFVRSVEGAYKKAVIFEHQSRFIFQEAQTILLSELGLLDWQPKHRLSFVKNYSDTEQSERFDAEYFQPKYEEIVKAIKSYKGGWDTLSNLCNLVGHPSNPPYAESNDKDKTFIVTQKHLGDYSLNDEFWKDEDALYTTNEFVKKNSQYILKQDDVLLYSVGAYIGKANIYMETTRATIGSFLTLLRTKKEILNPYYLMVFLNTNIGVMISKQHQRGMAQQYLYPYDIRTFPIPLLNKEIQIQIQQKITESFTLRKQSKHLLECAKQAVEMAIERDEETALQWLKEVGRK